MRSNRVRGLIAIAVLLIGVSDGRAQLMEQVESEVRAGVPVVGLDIGASLPISAYQDTADPGGSVAPFVGFEIGGESFTVMPLIQGQFAGFPSCCGGTASISSVGGGMRFSLHDEKTEVYFAAAGNYYWHTSGPVRNHEGPGYDIQGGVNYDVLRELGVGLFARYDNASMRATNSGTDCTTEWVTVGLETRYKFLPPPPPPPPAPPVAAAPPPAPVKKKIVLRGVNFDFDKSNIRPDAVPILEAAAATLKENGEVSVYVDGYTDSVGTDAYNQKLSERRANSVRAYLEKLGITGTRMTARGFGETNPVASNETAEGRAQNRRVELIVRE